MPVIALDFERKNRAVLKIKIQPTTFISETEKKEHHVSMHHMHVRNTTEHCSWLKVFWTPYEPTQESIFKLN